MKIIKLLGLLIILTVTSCSQAIDGVYIVVDIKHNDGKLTTLQRCSSERVNGKTISGLLKEKFQGKKYQIKMKEGFAILRDLDEGEDIILARRSDNDGEFYSTEISKNNGMETYFVELRPNLRGTPALVVRLEAARVVSYIPAQVGGKFVGGNNTPCGRVICYLGKLD